MICDYEWNLHDWQKLKFGNKWQCSERNLLLVIKYELIPDSNMNS